MFPVSLNYTRGRHLCCPRWEGRALCPLSSRAVPCPSHCQAPAPREYGKATLKTRKNPSTSQQNGPEHRPQLYWNSICCRDFLWNSGQENLFRFPEVVGCMFPCSFAHHIFLTKCKISLSFHNLSLFLPFFPSPFHFFSLFNRFVFRSIRLVITRTQSSIFLLLERLLQCDGQIVRNNYTKWWKKINRKKSLPPSDAFYLRHSEHQAHWGQGETSKWSFAMGLFLIAGEAIRHHKMLHKPQIHTKANNVIVFFSKGTDDLDVREDNTRHFSTPPVLPEGLEITAVTAAGGVWRHLRFLVVLTHQIKQPSG